MSIQTTYNTYDIPIASGEDAQEEKKESITERLKSFTRSHSSAEWPSLDNDETEITELKRTDSLELLDPVHASPLRKSNMLIATFNLVATIVGGGVLSLPLSFEKAGIWNATILMIVSAIMTDFSLYVLCSCSRRTGARSFTEVGRLAFGSGMEGFTIMLLFIFLIFVIIAYMVLVRDIWTPILKFLIGLCLNHPMQGNEGGNAVLLVIVLLMTPFLLKKDLHALRHNCYIGFASILVLCLAMFKRAFDSYDVVDDDDDINYSYTNFTDTLFAFPIITLSFLSSFNVISVHAALIDPTRKRVKTVIHSAVASCFSLYYIFGLAGYFYAKSSVRGNILLNFPFDDHLILIGRIGCGITIAFALPIVLLPCREALFDIINRLSHHTHPTDFADTTIVEEHSPLVQKITEPMDTLSNNKKIHVTSTFSIMILCYICAVAAPGVATVWSICGSSMAFLIAFTLPTLFYIKIRIGRKGLWNKRILVSWFIFAFSIVGASACTLQIIWRMLFSDQNLD